jgi:hypothetical protein
VDSGKSNPAIDTVYFPATVAGGYWSSTAYAIFLAHAWFVNFVLGGSGGNNRININQVRCVAGP